MRMICAGLLVACIANVVIASAPGASFSTNDSRLRGDLADVMQRAADDDLIPISIVMARQASASDFENFQRQPRHERRRLVVAQLKRVATGSHRALLTLLEARQAVGRVGPRLRPLWISNVIVTEATRDVIEQISQRDDVAYINHNRPVAAREIFPIEPARLDVRPLPGAGAAIECGVDLMRAPQVWDDFGVTGDGVLICVLDSGACTTHPDLVNQIWANPGEIPNNNVDDDSNGFIDDIVGWDFADDDNTPNDIFNHGTHVSGTVGGDGTNGEQTGMAPNVTMMQCKISGSFSDEAQVWDSMQYAVDNGADIVTASLGWPHSTNPDRPTWRAICENTIATGMVVIYASGNEGGCCPPDNVRTPGDVPDVITIGATDCSRSIASFSSRGPITWQGIPPYNDWPYPPGKMKPTVSAPGVNTLSTSNNCFGYFNASGTSMSTPHVAGAVALMLEANPNLDHFDVKQILVDTALDQGSPGWDNDYGAGFVDAYDAVVAAIGSGPTPASIDSIEVVTGTPLGGDTTEVEASDDQYYEARSGFGPTLAEAHLLQVAVQATTEVPSPNDLTVTVESHIDEPTGTLSVLLLNHATGEMDLIGQFVVGVPDTTVEMTDLDASDYVDQNGEIQLELEIVVFAPFLAFQFDTAIDWVEIAVQ